MNLSGEACAQAAAAGIYPRHLVLLHDDKDLPLGTGRFQRPLADYVLGPWTDPEWERLDALDAPFARFLELLGGAEDLTGIANQVNSSLFWGDAAD